MLIYCQELIFSVLSQHWLLTFRQYEKVGENMNQTSKTIFIAVGAAVIVGVVSFTAGQVFQKNSDLRANRPGRFAAFGQSRISPNNRTMTLTNRQKGGQTSGQITAISGNNMTIKLFDGTTRTVTLSGGTTYTKVGSVDKSSLQVGENVVVVGQASQGGSLTASQVRIGS